MSDYLVHEMDRVGVDVRDRSEVAALHGDDGRLEGVTLKSGERLPFSFLFLFLGARPCTEWIDDVVARDDDGFVLTGTAAGTREPSRDERARDLCCGRRPLGLHQAMRDGGRRGRNGCAVRPSAPRRTRTCSRRERAGAAVDITEGRPMTEAIGTHSC